MEVVIPKDQLIRSEPCFPTYLSSPEWDDHRKALVYRDWDQTVKRLSETEDGLNHLGWLVARDLVPMTRAEFFKLRREARKNQGR